MLFIAGDLLYTGPGHTQTRQTINVLSHIFLPFILTFILSIASLSIEPILRGDVMCTLPGDL